MEKNLIFYYNLESIFKRYGCLTHHTSIPRRDSALEVLVLTGPRRKRVMWIAA
jgi:hypothetical protein